ncbi:hypothetical protein CE91St63_03450 [[Clostridium] hylemonae]|nr:hypothetical protein CE91St63_03450 [[Clostridium] hylemonae]
MRNGMAIVSPLRMDWADIELRNRDMILLLRDSIQTPFSTFWGQKYA